MAPGLDLSLENSLTEIPRVLEALDLFLDSAGPGAAAGFDLRLALDEVLSNVVLHAFPEGGQHRIEVAITLDGALARCTIRDTGLPFDPLTVPDADTETEIEDRGIGGLGVHFVRQIMQEVAYAREDGQNVLRMACRLDAPAG